MAQRWPTARARRQRWLPLEAAGPCAYTARAGERRAPAPAGGFYLSLRDVRRAAGAQSTVAKWVFAMPLRLLC